MTLTLELTPNEESRLADLARQAGTDPVSYVRGLITESQSGNTPHVSHVKPRLVDRLKALGAGSVRGKDRVDGRPWSEIEAASDAH